ncbi:VOC family protein [Methylobacterium sp. J-077]|uniref:VOC family protein n=1 Tax=Methylobacterium sp. J-077 TaxID=2836656 RepID=UPI001FB8D0C5|nr:VOC family protein [Methylobacterium sp. J-077]MCJ2127006.1 VOC family protein [Methylobacterium sp. J-077]
MEVPMLQGIHHLKFPVVDLGRSLAFYERILGARRVGAWDHVRADGSVYAVILKVPGLGAHLELRLNPVQAERQAGFDPVTLAVRDRAELEGWIAHLAAAGIDHSPILVSIQAWLVVFADPDGRRLRLYTRESHGPELPPDATSPWIAGD